MSAASAAHLCSVARTFGDVDALEPKTGVNRWSRFPEPALLDVTLRDGGFCNAFSWTEEDMVCFAMAVAAAGLAGAELGYIGGVPELHGVADPGPAAYLSPEVVHRVSGFAPSEVAAMVHPKSAVGPIDFVAYRQAGLSMVRFVFHPSWASRLAELLDEAKTAGLRTTVNIALCSMYPPESLAGLAGRLSLLSPDVLYLADTNAALFPGQVLELVAMVRERASVQVGFHAHDFLSLAFANSLAAACAGATHVDCSLWGIGRSAGNLRAELWVAAAIAQQRGAYRITPLVSACNRLARHDGTRSKADLTALVAGAFNLWPPAEDELRFGAREHELADRASAFADECFKGVPE